MSKITSDKQPRKRKRFFRLRFGLRSLLLLTLFVAVLCAWLVQCASEQASEADAISALKEAYGNNVEIYFDYQCDEMGEVISTGKNAPPPQPPGLWIVRRVLGEHIFSRVACVGLYNEEANGDRFHKPISKFKHLRKIELDAFYDVEDLNMLTNLRTLYVTDCELTNLEAIASARKLKSISLGWGSILSKDDMEIISNFHELESLVIDKAQEIKDLTWTKNLPKLRKLKIYAAPKISSLAGLEHCSQLTDLHLEQTGDILSLAGVEELEQLERLELTNSYSDAVHGVDSLAPLRKLQKLTTLTLQISSQVESLDAIADLRQLKTLSLAGASSVADLDVLANMKNLSVLKMPRSGVRNLDLVKELPNLQSIQFSKSEKLTNLAGLTDHPTLAICDFSECQQLRDITPLGTLKACGSIRLMSCSQIESLEGLESLAKLEVLSIINCKKIKDLKPLAGLPAIRTLFISGCSNLTSLDGINNAASLRYFKFSDCKLLSDVSALAGRDFPDLTFRNCPSIESLAVLSQTSVARLRIESCPNLVTVGLPKVPSGQGIRSEPSISISDCGKLNRLTVPQSHQGGIGFLAVQGDRATDLLESLPDGFEVKILTIMNANGMQDLNSIAKLKELELLNLFNCDDLTDLTTFPTSQTLTEIFIKNCDSLSEFSPPHPLPALSTLTIWFNSALQTLEIERMPSLTTLKVFHCPKLTTVTGLDDLSDLYWLELKKCGKIQPPINLSFPMLRVLTLDNSDLIPHANATAGKEFIDGKSQTRDRPDGFSSPNNHSFLNVRIGDCSRMNNFDWLANLPDPNVLHLGKASQLKHFTGKRFPELRFLTINDATELETISLSPAPMITINLIGCDKLPPTETMRQLLEHTKSLEHLSLSGDSAAAALPQLHCFRNLRTFTISNCPQLTNGQQLSECTAEEISLIDCGQLTSIKDLCDSSIARRLTLENCPAIQDLDSLHLFESLTGLTLKKLYQDQLEELRFGRNCCYLFIEGCKDLVALTFEARLQPFSLHTNSCPLLETIKLNPSNTEIGLNVSDCQRLSAPSIEEIKRRNGVYSLTPRLAP